MFSLPPSLTRDRSKDIISPAQAVIMKLLTKIFHARQGGTSTRSGASNTPGVVKTALSTYPEQVDIQIVHFLFNEFRQNIVPQICALIFLQGQIRAGKASPDDFPLNLWDMERMYEGVYQYLEFFAILTDHDAWKNMMAEWEVTSELITLLRELELAIPKGRLAPAMPSGNEFMEPKTGSVAAGTAGGEIVGGQATKAVSVERPYDPLDNSAFQEGEPVGDSDLPYDDAAQEEPADFEWRNLKKLCVLVLSSLVWKNRALQDQVRQFDGVMTILSCCAFDEHNPYIREHAIMCLRFLTEGNLDNQEIIRKLQARNAVPSEVLDQNGYETFMDNRGQVGLRRKEAARAPTPPASSAARFPSLPASLPEWMQMAMKAIPGQSK